MIENLASAESAKLISRGKHRSVIPFLRSFFLSYSLSVSSSLSDLSLTRGDESIQQSDKFGSLSCLCHKQFSTETTSLIPTFSSDHCPSLFVSIVLSLFVFYKEPSPHIYFKGSTNMHSIFLVTSAKIRRRKFRCPVLSVPPPSVFDSKRKLSA